MNGDSQRLSSTFPKLKIYFCVEGNQAEVVLEGAWLTRYIGPMDDEVRRIELGRDFLKATINLSGIISLDTGGAWLIERMRSSLEKAGKTVSVEGSKTNWITLFKAVGQPLVVSGTALPSRQNFGIVQRLCID